jgi:adenine-specific DNA-methyltransferase
MAGYKFKRQHPIGPYTVDFYCAAGSLFVELDGGRHFEAENSRRDAERTKFLEGRGLRVLRFTSLEALNQTDAVLDVILGALRNSESPSP